ncbi:tandem-95 repeat protein, partial [Psychrobacter sanguinis]
MKNIIVKTHNNKTQISEVTATIHDNNQKTVIDAAKNVNYEFLDESLGYAPNHIITKRVGKDLHVSFEVEGKDSDLIINGFFDDENQALIGLAEDGRYYYYIPDTGEVVDYVTQLEVGAIEGQALGGESMIEPLWIQMASTGLPWWATGIGGLLAAGVIGAAASSGGGGSKTEQPIDAIDDGSVNNPYSSVAEDTPLTNLKVLSNDISPEGRPLSIVAASSPNGEVAINPDGTLNFMPAANFNGPTTITYTISDGAGGRDTATVHIDVTDVNDAPEAKSQRIVIDENTIIETPLTGSDVDGDVVSITVIQVPAASQGFLSYAKNGTRVEITANAVLTPEEAESVTFTVTENFNGTVNPIKFSTTDDDGAVSTPATVEITVSDVNDAPEAMDATVNTREGTPVSVPLIATDIDGMVKSITITAIPDAAREGVLTYIDAGGNEQIITVNTVLSVDEASTVVFTPVANFNGAATSVTFTATDDDGLVSAPATVTLDVTDVNTPPVAEDAAITTNEDTAVPVPFTGSDVDGTVVSVTVLQVPPSNQGILVYDHDNNPDTKPVQITANAALSLAQAETVQFVSAKDFNGVVNPIRFTTTDDDGMVSSPAMVSINVSSVIDVTYVVMTGDGTVVEAEAAGYGVQLLDNEGSPVVVTQDTAVTVTFNNSTTQDTDTEYSDGKSITVTIPAGSSTASFDVQTIDDYLADDGERYSLTITDVDTDEFEAVDINGFTDSNNVVHSNTVGTTIESNSTADSSNEGGYDSRDTVYVELTGDASTDEVAGSELNHQINLIDDGGNLVVLAAAQSVTVTLEYYNDGTQAADFTTKTTDVTLTGTNTGNVTNVVADDLLSEGVERYSVRIIAVSDNDNSFETLAISDSNKATGTIIDNDSAPVISIAKSSDVNEDAGTVTYTVSLSNPSTQSV